MELEEIERLAASGEAMPDGLNGAQQKYYQGIAYLYARYREGDISKKEGAQAKVEMRKAYEADAFDLSCWEASRKMWVDLAGPAADFRKNPTVENAERVMNVIFRVQPTRTKGTDHNDKM